jgi:hypothetical protein
MKIIKSVTITKEWLIKSIKHPYSNRNSIIDIRTEKNCVFCNKRYFDCDFFGIVMTDKGSKICCDDCCKNIDNQLKV